MTLGWPQGIILGVVFLSVCRHATKNGQPREGNYDLGFALIDAALLLGLLNWGGFFG